VGAAQFKALRGVGRLVRFGPVMAQLINQVHDLDDAAGLGEASMGALEHAILGNDEAKTAFVVAAAAKLGLALVGAPGVGKTQLVEHALPMIADLTDDQTRWLRPAGNWPMLLTPTSERVWVQPGQIDIVPAEPSIFERHDSPAVLVFDMLDGFENERELHAFATSRAERWKFRIQSTSPLDRSRLLISTWVVPPERGLEVPSAMRRLHHIAVGLPGRRDLDDEQFARQLGSEPPIWPAPPTATWSALDGLDRVAREQVSFDVALWEIIKGGGARERLGSTRSTVAQHVACVLAALEGRSEVAKENLERAARWTIVTEEL
jgi:Magnesium chelatase, subunit ChlI